MEEIIKDSRFSHVARDPRFKRISRQEKKIKIDKRFQSMFKDERFKVNYTVDKRGRPITHTSNEDLKRYYALSSDEDRDSEYESTSNNSSDTSTETNKDLKYTETFSTKSKPDEPGGSGSSPDGLDKIEISDKKDEVRIKKHNISSEGLNNNLMRKKMGKQKWKRGLELNPDNEVSSNADDINEEKEVVADSVKKKLRDLTVDYARGEGALFSDSSSDEESSESGLSHV